MGSKNIQVANAYSLNTQTHVTYYKRLKLLATSMFKWEGLPNGIPERFIEEELFQVGHLAFVDHPFLGYLVANCNPSGELNHYNVPIFYDIYGINLMNKRFNTKDIVIIRNNIDELPTKFLIMLYVNKLTELDRTIDVNIRQQKTPSVIECSEEQRITMNNLFAQYEGNVPFIFGNKDLSLEGIKTWAINAPFVTDKLQEQKNKIWAECLDMLGINNANTHKRERLITDEVNSNNQLLQLASDVFLLSRQLACEEINNKFGTNISVKRREEIINKEGDENWLNTQ